MTKILEPISIGRHTKKREKQTPPSSQQNKYLFENSSRVYRSRLALPYQLDIASLFVTVDYFFFNDFEYTNPLFINDR